MKKLVLIILSLNLLSGISKWETRHYEFTDNGFLAASAPDSLTGYLIGARDDVGGIVFKTVDGGNTWNELWPFTFPEGFFLSGCHFTTINTGYVTALDIIFNFFPAAAIYTTQNGANSFTRIYGGTFSDVGKFLEDIFFYSSNNGWAVGVKGKNGFLVKTTNGGSSWTEIEIPPVPPETTLTLKALYFINNNEGWIVGGTYDTLTGKAYGGVIFHTQDGGNSFTLQLHDSVDLWDVYFIDNQRGWACGWTHPDSPGVILKTENGGNTWSYIRGPDVSIGDYALFSIDYVDGIVFASGGGNRSGWQGSYFGIFLKSYDGSNFFVDTVIYENDPGGVSPIGMDMYNSRWGYAGGARLSVFRYGPTLNAEEKEIASKENNPEIKVKNSGIEILLQENVKRILLFDISGRKILEILNPEKRVFIPENKRGIYFIKGEGKKGFNIKVIKY